jgi:hypothetical protein
MLTINHLEVCFDVDGDGEQVFASLFDRHIRRWSRLAESERSRRRILDQERRLGDREARDEA